MTGLIWLIQCVHYPFAQVGAEAFQDYHARHTQWITPIVGPLMLIELGTAFLLASLKRHQQPYPFGKSDGPWAGHGDLGINGALQIPLHNSLGRGLTLKQSKNSSQGIG